MLPVFKEYIDFLRSKTNEKLEWLEEGCFWYDHSLIKGIESNGNIVKVARVKIDDKLNLTISKHKEYKSQKIETWNETINRNKDYIYSLEKESIELIKKSMEDFNDSEYIILTSGGKDSSVVMHLVRKIKEDCMGVFNNTSLDCADTYEHIKKLKNIRVMNPKEGFYQWRNRNNFVPTRFARACCSIFKEGEFVRQWEKEKKTLIFMGMRNEESSTRSDYGDYWRNENEWSVKWNGVLPIRKWSELDVWLYILKEEMEFNKKYKKGYSRVGCAVACPYYTNSTWVLDEYWYPVLYKRWHDILDEDFTSNNKDIIMNCTQEEYHSCWNGGALRKEPTEEVIKQYAERNGLDYEVAKNYFNHTCIDCDKRIKHKEVIGMNMKYYGRNLEKFRCKKCLMKDLNIDKEQWETLVKDFKSQGCSLF